MVKEKLENVLGGFGAILWYIISIVYSFGPLYILHFPFWLDAILIAVILFLPFIGELVRLALYIWALIVVLTHPIDIVSVIFLVLAALYFFTTVFPILVSFFSSKVDNARLKHQITHKDASYSEIIEKYYEAGIKLLSTLPGFSGDRFELMPFLALIGAASLESEGKELSKYQEEINSYLKTKLHIDREFNLFDERFKFYYEVSTGAPVYGFWSVDNIPTSVLSVPMLRCAVAFGDCITDPERIKDYENAPVLVMGYPDMCTFTKIFTTQFYSFVKTYCTEIVGYDFVPKTLSLN